MVREMFRLAALSFAITTASAGCSSDSTCGKLTLQLGEDTASYPTAANIGCDVQDGGWWDKVKNEAGFALTSSDLPVDVRINAVMPLDKVKPNVTFTVPTGIAGEAYTGATKNQANLTGGTIVIQQDLGVDDAKMAHVFKIHWELEWLGTGTYHSTGDGAAVWFTANHGL